MNLDNFFNELFEGATFKCQAEFEPGNQERAPINLGPYLQESPTFDPGSILIVPAIVIPGSTPGSFRDYGCKTIFTPSSIVAPLINQMSTNAKTVHMVISQELNFFRTFQERQVTLRYANGKLFTYTGADIVDSGSGGPSSCILELGHGTKPFSVDCMVTLSILAA
jgi:hypothetical protein